MTSTYTVLATYPADTTPARRWEIWDAVAPLFERHGFHGVTIDELAREAGLRTADLYRHFSSKQVLALFPLSRSNGIYRSWVARAATLPREPEVRRRAMLDFAAEHAAAWRLALDLATEMIMTPPLDRYAGRLVKEAREDFGAIVGSVDPTMTPGQYVRLYRAFHQVVTPDASSRADVPGHGGATAAVTTYWPLRS
jgi:AcrR family transcriptional regulator